MPWLVTESTSKQNIFVRLAVSCKRKSHSTDTRKQEKLIQNLHGAGNSLDFQHVFGVQGLGFKALLNVFIRSFKTIYRGKISSSAVLLDL